MHVHCACACIHNAHTLCACTWQATRTPLLVGVLSGATAVISCVGIAPGGANQRAGNGAVNVRIADAAKARPLHPYPMYPLHPLNPCTLCTL